MFSGNLTRDPELRTLDNGTKVLSLSIALDNSYKNKAGERVDDPCFIECEAWAQGAELIDKYFSKGEPIVVETSAKMDTWEDKTTGQKRNKVKFRVNEFWFVPKYNYKKSQLSNDASESDEQTEKPAKVKKETKGGGDIPF